MVQTVTLPFAALNALPGLSGIEDVTFNVPELVDIRETIRQETVTAEDLTEPLDERLDQLAAEIVEEVEARIPTIEVPGVDQVAEAVVRELTDLDGFFGPIEGDFRRALEDVLGDAGLDVDSLADGLTAILEAIETVQDDVASIEVPAPEDIETAVSDGLTAAIEAQPGGQLLTDPEAFIDDQLARITDDLVDEAAREELVAATEDLEEQITEVLEDGST